MVDSCRIFASSSIVLKGCGVLLGVTFIIHCVGIGTTYWLKYDPNEFSNGYHSGTEYHSGLFQVCTCFTYYTEKCMCSSISEIATGWLKGVQALEIIGLIAIIWVGFMIFLQFFFTQSVSIKIWGIMLITFAGACILAGVILYCDKMRSNISFSLGLCAVSAFLCFVCSTLLFQDRRISMTHPRADQIHYANQGQIIESPISQAVIAYQNQIQSSAYPGMHEQYVSSPSYSIAQQQCQFIHHQNGL